MRATVAARPASDVVFGGMVDDLDLDAVPLREGLCARAGAVSPLGKVASSRPLWRLICIGADTFNRMSLASTPWGSPYLWLRTSLTPTSPPGSGAEPCRPTTVTQAVALGGRDVPVAVTGRGVPNSPIEAKPAYPKPHRQCQQSGDLLPGVVDALATVPSFRSERRHLSA